MKHTSIMKLRLAAPACAAAVAAIALLSIGDLLPPRLLVQPLVQDVLRIVVLAGCALGITAALLAYLAAARYDAWTEGDALTCDCGCLLGRERTKRFGPFRRCLGCSRNAAQRYYARQQAFHCS